MAEVIVFIAFFGKLDDRLFVSRRLGYGTALDGSKGYATTRRCRAAWPTS